MARAKLAPVNGSLAVGGVGGDFASFDLEARQQVDDVTGYNETVDADHAGSGVRAWALDFSGFCEKGAAGTSVGMAAFTGAGVAVVATLDTSVSYSGNFVIESIRVSHRKTAGAVPFQGRAFNKGAITEAWVVA
jgi:hypothetical protein